MRPGFMTGLVAQPRNLRIYRSFSGFKDPKAVADEAMKEAKEKAKLAKDLMKRRFNTSSLTFQRH